MKSNSVFHQLDLDLLKHFYAIASYGGFSKASRAIGVSQPTLSLGLQRLEKNLGVLLIERDSRQFELTRHGLSLLSFCQRLEGNLESIVDTLGTKAVSIRKRLRIGTALSIGFAPLADICDSVTHSGEPLDLELKSDNSYALLKELNDGTLDAALLLDDVYDGNLTLTRLWQDQLIFVAAKRFEREMTELDMSGDWRSVLEKVPLITYPRETPMRALVDKLRLQEKLRFNAVISASSVDALRILLARNAGGAFILRSLVEGDLKTRHLVEVGLPISQPRSHFLLATRPGEQGEATIKLMRELLGR